MPERPAAGAGPPKSKQLVIVIDSDDDGGGPAPVAGAAIAAAGEALRLVKPEPVDDAGFNLVGAGSCSRAMVAISPRAENPRALSTLRGENPRDPRARQNPRAPSQPPPPVAAVRPSGRPQPDIVDVSEGGGSSSGFRGVLPARGVLMIEGSSRGVGRVKEEEPLDDFGFNIEVSAADAARALVAVVAPGSTASSRKRRRESPDRAHGGGLHAAARNSSASGTGRRATEIAEGARSSGEKQNGKSRAAGRGGTTGDRSHSANKGLVPSEESRGPLGKARRGGGARSGDRRTSVAPANLFGSTVGSRIRERSRQQRRVEYSYPVPLASDDTEESEEEEQQLQRERGEELDDDSGAGNGVAQGREHEEAVEGKSRQESDHGETQDEYREGEDSATAAPADNEEEVGEKELDEEMEEKELDEPFEDQEESNQEDSNSIYEGDEEEQEEDESEEDEQALDGTGEEHRFALSNTMAAGSVRSEGQYSRVFRKRIFEGICLLENPAKTDGKGIEERTRSKRKCKDRKLLRRGTFSKPYNIDVPDSTSDSEEDIVPPVPQRNLMSSSEEDNGPKRKRRRKRNKRRLKMLSTSSDDSVEYRAYGRDARDGSYRRLKKGTSNLQAAKEGHKNHDGSNAGRAKYNGPDGGKPMNAQDDISFKKNAHTALMKKRGRAAKAAYEELLNSLFAEWESHIDVPDFAGSGNSLPLQFSFGDEDEPEEKTENDKSQEEIWKELDMIFESMNIGSHDCEAETNNGQKDHPGEETSCKHGKHDFIIDEQIGVRCKHCNIVDLEIRYILPSMGKNAAERESTANPELDTMFKEMLNVFEENDLLVSNGNKIPCSFDISKAGSVWDLIPGVKESMFPHQQDAFEFMWRKLAGGTTIEQLKCGAKTEINGGCVISHAPGTGKTRLAITFVQSYLEVFPHCSPVIIAPRGMLTTWEDEFKKWKVKLPFHVLNSSEINWNQDKTIQEQIAKNGTFHRRLLTDKMDKNYRRLVKLGSWMNGTSIIGVSYSLFRKLVFKKPANDEGVEGDKVRKLLLEKPDLLILDEGHTPRNKKSLIWKVLSEVRTEKRIILSGTPFQNNFEELYNTLYLVRPKDAAVLLEKDEGKDFWTSLRLNDITEANIDKVKKKLDPVVHIHSGNFLQKSLPGLRESVVILNPLPYQKEVIASMETLATGLEAEYKISLASIHPSLIASAKLSEQEESMVNKTMLETLRTEPSVGVKTRFVLEIVNSCQVLNERVLVFSQYLEPLYMIMEQLKKRFSWAEGKEILLMSGNVPVRERQTMMESFNNLKSKAKVMLASTKACCEGITLIGASRVVLLDVVWNPSVGRQAIGRAYRIGQEKIVYTYNLIAEGTTEKSKYDRQAKKEHMSKLLFSKEPQAGGSNLSPELTFNDRILEEMTAREDLKKLFVKIYVDNQTDGSPGEMDKNNTSPHLQ